MGRSGDTDQRNRLIAAGAWFAAGCTVLNLIGSALGVTSDVRHHVLTGVGISDGFALCAPVLTLLGATMLGFAFAGPADRRNDRFAAAAVGFGGSFASVCVSASILSGVFVAHHAPGSLNSSLIAGSVAAALATLAFVTASTAVRGRGTSASALAERDAVLGRAAGVFAVAMVATLTSDVLALVASSSLMESSAGKTVEWLQLATAVGQFAVALVFAAALLAAANGRRLATSAWLERRDRTIGRGGVLLAAALLAYAASAIVQAANGGVLPGLLKTARWLGAAGDVTIVIAFVLAAAGFLISGSRTVGADRDGR